MYYVVDDSIMWWKTEIFDEKPSAAYELFNFGCPPHESFELVKSAMAEPISSVTMST